MRKSAEEKLSPRARTLLARVRDSSRFYRWKVPAEESRYMRELLDAGLVGTMGRVARIELCYVPRGTKGFKVEEFPNDRR